MSTIKDVAKKAGVSVSTVSYAMSGVRSVSEETRQRVLQAVEELNYHPNLLAQGLINKRTSIIALLYPTLSMSSLDDDPVQFIASVSNAAYEHDYGLLLFTHPLDEKEILRFINQGIVDGVILMEVLRQDPRVALMKKVGYPFSLIGHGAENDGISYVDMDFYHALKQASSYLARLNHREIAYIPTIVDIQNPRQNYLYESIRGFRETTAREGISGVIQGCNPTIQGAHEAMRELLETHPGVSAAILGNELIYVGAMQALNEKGLRVPDDFSIIGEISQNSAIKYTPKVTSLAIPAIEMGRLGAEFLIAQLENKEQKPQQVILPPKFVIRETTSPRREP